MQPYALAIGDVVGGYELLREIGRGGMAEVWVARRATSTAGKFVAVKMVLPQYVGDDRYSRMFATEAQVSAPLSHSNIVQVFDEGEDNGRSYLVMEWVDGVDLAQLLPDMQLLQKRDPVLRLRIAAYVIGQLLHGLSYAHRVTTHDGQTLGIVHRDISPQNVLVSVSGDVKVTDFGIAHRMSEETTGLHIKGKLRYMPPEQLGGRSHAPTVDLYAVGAMLHELVDGNVFRYDADDHVSLYHQVMSGTIPPLTVSDVPAELDAVRLALLQPDPAARPQSADEALMMLKRWSGYAEMKVELAQLCGLATGVARPRTGPEFDATAAADARASRLSGLAGLPPGLMASLAQQQQQQQQLGPDGRPLPSTVPTTNAPIGAAAGHAPTGVAGHAPSVGGELDAPAARWGVAQSTGRTGAAGTEILGHGELPFSDHGVVDPTIALGGDGAHGRPTTSPDFPASQTAPGALAVPGARGMHETTVSQIDLPRGEPSGRRTPWGLLVGLSLVAAIGIGTTIALVMPGPSSDAAATGAAVAVKPTTPRADAPEAPAPEPDDAGPKLTALAPGKPADPVAAEVVPPVAAAEPTPVPAPTPAPTPAVDAPTPAAEAPPPEPTPAVSPNKPSKPSTKRPASKPEVTPSKPAKPEPAPAGPAVLVHFRLADDLAGADVKLGAREIAVRPRYDARIPAGHYAVKWRADPGAPWKSAGSVDIGSSGEWKLIVGKSGARASKM